MKFPKKYIKKEMITKKLLIKRKKLNILMIINKMARKMKLCVSKKIISMKFPKK